MEETIVGVRMHGVSAVQCYNHDIVMPGQKDNMW